MAIGSMTGSNRGCTAPRAQRVETGNNKSGKSIHQRIDKKGSGQIQPALSLPFKKIGACVLLMSFSISSRFLFGFRNHYRAFFATEGLSFASLFRSRPVRSCKAIQQRLCGSEIPGFCKGERLEYSTELLKKIVHTLIK